MVKEKKGQPTWLDLQHQDLRHIATDLLPTGEQVSAGSSADEAIQILEVEIGFADHETEILVTTPIGDVAIRRDMLGHIVEKRHDARERYVRMAISTMKEPFEVWAVEYDDQTTRHAYIGAFNGKTHLLVVVTHVGGSMLWNFMHGDAKAINKHRHGECLHRRSFVEITYEVEEVISVTVDLDDGRA